MLDKAEEGKPATPQTNNPVSTSATPTLREPKLAPRFASPAPQPSRNVPQAAAPRGKPGLDLPEIPSFAQLKQQKEAKTAGAAKAEAWIKNNNAAPTNNIAPQGAPSTASKFSATAKEFKPNPNALSFTPVSSIFALCASESNSRCIAAAAPGSGFLTRAKRSRVAWRTTRRCTASPACPSFLWKPNSKGQARCFSR